MQSASASALPGLTVITFRRLLLVSKGLTQRPSPLHALEWLRNGAGLSVAAGAEFRAKIEAERQARRYW